MHISGSQKGKLAVWSKREFVEQEKDSVSQSDTTVERQMRAPPEAAAADISCRSDIITSSSSASFFPPSSKPSPSSSFSTPGLQILRKTEEEEHV